MARQAPRGGFHPELTFPHTQEWELHHNGFSLCSKKVRVCLAELELPYRGHHVHLIETGAYETVRRAFLAINPAGTVPVLLHHGHPVYESHDQIAYAATHARAGAASLPPADATVERWTDCASLVGDPLAGMERRAGHCVPPLTFPLFATMIAYVPYREILRGLLTHPNKERPVFFALLKLRTVRGLPGIRPAMDALARARLHMAAHLDALGRHLEGHGGPWIAGDVFTLADVSWVVILDRLVEADWAAWFWGDGRRPAIAAYWERLRARPSYRVAILEQRTPITERGIADLARAKAEDAELRRRLEPPDGAAPSPQ